VPTTWESRAAILLLKNGKVLGAGGDATFYGGGSSSRSTSATEVFDPATGTFAAAPDMSSPRESHTATLLTNGAILITGGGDGTIGYSPTTVLASSDLYAWH
jgi:galactose oxidase-like protein